MNKRRREYLELSSESESDEESEDDETIHKSKKFKCDPSGSGHGFHFETRDAPEDLTIESIPTSKDKIEQPELAEHEDMFIPPLGSSVIIAGKSGCGKSTLLANLIKDPRFYGPSDEKPNGWFDKIFLFSPTANGDDVQKSLGIDKKHVFTDLDEAPELLDVILNSQQKKLDKSEGADKVEQYAIIFDDVIGDTCFMNERSFTRCFYQVRHVNCSTFICTQHFKRVPKVCRLQANFVFFFQGSASEVEIVTEEFAPPEYTKKEFAALVNAASCEKFSFLTINMKVGWDKRFRKKLDEFIVLDRLQSDEKDDPNNKNESKKKEKEYAENEDRKEQEREINDSINLTINDRGTDFEEQWHK
jgi:hypothetical protein